MSTNAREQLFGDEGFGDVVVGPRLQTEDNVGGLVARRHDDDWKIARRSKRLTGLKSRHARQHDVDNGHVRGHARKERDAQFTRGGVVNDEALAFEHQSKRGANVVVVFYDQDTGHPNSFGIFAKTSKLSLRTLKSLALTCVGCA